MMASFSRVTRVEEYIARRLAVILQQRFKEPRLKMLSVHRVMLSRDLKFAKVHVTVLNDCLPSEEVIALLNQAKPELRQMLATNIALKRVPELKFIYDTSIANGRRVIELIHKTVTDNPESY